MEDKRVSANVISSKLALDVKSLNSKSEENLYYTKDNEDTYILETKKNKLPKSLSR